MDMDMSFLAIIMFLELSSQLIKWLLSLWRVRDSF